MSSIGVLARPLSRALASSAAGSPPESTPKTSAFTSAPHALHPSHGTRHEAVDVGLFGVDERLHVGDVVLEGVALDGGHDSLGDPLGRLLLALVDRRVLAGDIPDLGVDGARVDEADLERRVPEIDGHGLAPPAQGELAGAVGGFTRVAEATGDARHVDDRALSAVEHLGQAEG